MKAIILKKQPTREHDLLVTCYTDQLGKVTAVAKSALKPGSTQGMHLDAFNLVEFDLVSGRSAPIIVSAQSHRTHVNLKRSLPGLAASAFLSETMDKLVYEYQPDERLWTLAVQFLEDLDAGRVTLRTFRERQGELLNVLGYLPEGGLAVPGGPVFSALDARFQELAGARFSSLPFLYSVLK